MESLKTILYFSIFKYPLKLEEICSYYPEKDHSKVETELQLLLDRKIIQKVGDYYLRDCDPDCIEKRQLGNRMAANAMIKASERAGLISKFPFVEAVGISGSLSKGCYDHESDIDFFVITRPGRLWVARTLLMLYKKIFLLNSRKYFCINYFVASDKLEIEEKNRFTATEIKTLIPMQGGKLLKEFYEKNTWISSILGAHCPDLSAVPEISKPLFAKTIEWFLCGSIGKSVDSFLRKLTLRFWERKFSAMTRDDFNIALKSTPDVSKHHPLNFQKKVIRALNEKYEELRQSHNIVLQKEYV
ncbi:MAG: nucleotidyltransferase domain-containing protein [Flavobacterium sp.]|nr:MAG: nucleotidyltransferase domain-containing protein [Flavobacterium sp.]